MATIIDGKLVSASVRGRIREEVAALSEQGIRPGLAVVIVGDDPASRVYVNGKKKACAEVGIYSEEYALPASTTEEQLLELVAGLNQKAEISGILVQLPLPAHIDSNRVLLAIDPRKDVDAFHPTNVGHIMIGDYQYLPCTPAGIMELLHYYQLDVAGRECVVILWASRWRCCCCTKTARSPSPTPRPGTCRPSPAGRISWWRPSARLGL